MESSQPIGRRLTVNTVIRRHQIEATRTRSLWEDETELHSAALVERFSDAVRSAVPDARITWALSWGALTDDSPRYRDIRTTLARITRDHGDDVAFVPGGFFANLYGSRDEVSRDILDAADLISDHFGRDPRSLVAGFLAAANIAAARERGMRTVQGNIWSQFDIDLQDGDGSIAYPYYPSRSHFLVPGRGDERIDAVQLDGWTVDLVAARAAGMSPDHNSRLGLGPIETLHRLPRAEALRELEATSEAHFDARNVERNGLGWLTVNYEISEVARGLAVDPHMLDAWTGWIRGLRDRWPDMRIPTIGEFGEEWRSRHRDNEGLAYLLQQSGSGVQASRAGETVTWFMTADYRLGVLEDEEGVRVFDYTDYTGTETEPGGSGDRRWSLLGEINQKGTRPQDRPQPIATFLAAHPDLDAALDDAYGDAPEVRALRALA
ncbi:DUF3863 domain-containing protein [Microbacterium sp. KSW4-11]|uniref:DUF3863 domain-containing protein n=1 Tax=Microbacterium gawkjiense TaxID=3067309 RepID=A0ABU3G8X5_9MICO|nr:DUF3863 domain-containing protein [Microbacterium sp. KSW4-11]MDT3316263.1 DUF3863 domain-containing protein [Microbacterium sp. KSW4-11]